MRIAKNAGDFFEMVLEGEFFKIGEMRSNWLEKFCWVGWVWVILSVKVADVGC